MAPCRQTELKKCMKKACFLPVAAILFYVHTGRPLNASQLLLLNVKALGSASDAIYCSYKFLCTDAVLWKQRATVGKTQ